MARTPLPDLVPVIVAWLRAEPAVYGTVAGISDHLPAAETRPWVAVTASGGTTLQRGWARERRITINVWAGSSEKRGRAQAREIAETVATTLEQLTDQTYTGIVFAAVDVLSDLTELPDPTFIPARPRCVFTMRAICHPTP